MTTPSATSLASGFLRSVQQFGSRRALEVAGESLSYAQLFDRAASLAATLVRHGPPKQPPLTAVLASRSVTAFAGVLGVLLRNHGYVPLSRAFPLERTRTMLSSAGCRAVVVDAESERHLEDLLEGMPGELLVLLPDRPDAQALRARWPRHRFLGAGDLSPAAEWQPQPGSLDAIAYLLFTSGSTGRPKGVMVTHRNARACIDFLSARFEVDHADRFSQMFDLTFDLSVADLFVAWERGACLCCPPQKSLINPGRFIQEAGLTVWFSVPSTASFMKRLGALKPGAYPRLRASLFCGEALLVDIARAWGEAAPHSVIDNLYGPTELTIACTCYRWHAQQAATASERGIVPIGAPFPGMRALVVDEAMAEVGPGEEGELLMSGPQLCPGYWQDPDRTAAAFVQPPGRTSVYYRTGDRVRKPVGDGPLHYLGRLDQQIKILGHRVELGEVEAVVREQSGINEVVAIGWPQLAGGAGGVEVFLQTDNLGAQEWQARVAARLPAYMTPRRYHPLRQFPLNANGKFDRGALAAHLAMLP